MSDRLVWIDCEMTGLDYVADALVEVGDQGSHLDQRIRAEIEAGHLTVDPHQSVVHP